MMTTTHLPVRNSVILTSILVLVQIIIGVGVAFPA